MYNPYVNTPVVDCRVFKTNHVNFIWCFF